MLTKVLNIPALLILALVQVSAGVSAQTYVNVDIDRAVQIALEKNRDIIQSREEVTRASLQITEAASAAYPQISTNWSLDKNLKPQVFIIQMPDSTGKITKNRLQIGTDYQTSLTTTLTQPLYVGGKVGAALKAARIYREMSDMTLDATVENVVAGVKTSFYGILFAREMESIARESLNMAQRHLENVRVLHENGRATDYDLLRAQVQVSNLGPDVVDARNQVTISLLELKNILGINPDAEFSINGGLAAPDTTMFAAAEINTAFENRSDLKTAELTIDLRDKAIKIARGDFLPTLSASTTFMFNGNMDMLRYNASDWTRSWFAGITLSIPIFSGFQTYSRYKQAQVDYRNAQIDYHRARDSVAIEVEEAVLNLRQAVNQIESRRLTVTEAERAVEIAESMYANGTATQLEVLDAQLSLAMSRNNYAGALFEGKVAEINLEKSLGLTANNGGRER